PASAAAASAAPASAAPASAAPASAAAASAAPASAAPASAERLASLGISYVLSVSRCTPQPTFLPCSRYLRVPIDDSLWDDLLPWIPKALHFIDAALSAGGSVLVHCAAGISRSPALAVAYVMYRLEMDLDHDHKCIEFHRIILNRLTSLPLDPPSR
uniref:protein-tyrosine-phosphatase n=1 Tax=Oryzias latipes TaxID=8090 RepID=A0A3P9HPQ5_ORYLA